MTKLKVDKSFGTAEYSKNQEIIYLSGKGPRRNESWLSHPL